MNSFIIRTISAFVFVALMLSALYYSHISFILLFSIIAYLTYVEFIKHISINTHRQLIYLSYFSSSIILTVSAMYFLGFVQLKHLLIGIPFVSAQYLYSVFLKDRNSFAELSKISFAQVYVLIPFIFFMHIAFTNDIALYEPHLVASFFILLWMNDAGAYLSGITFGKHKLIERISPNKTIEGFIGGMLMTLISSVLIALYFLPEISINHWLVLAVIIVLFGTVGDLFESLLKRTLGIKDSGNIMPGHGGFLDRFDALIGAAPAYFIYLYFFVG
ncbi:MAG TPA: phosphatidate cytidylyltransferase [Bacteroidia bacterium]|nr:phosphatidate cytidylyltransferase [Bacteroidia bacterium]HNT79493.1 phosphatidate cytidylyltransferase [Bacteroidia bacterium]